MSRVRVEVCQVRYVVGHWVPLACARGRMSGALREYAWRCVRCGLRVRVDLCRKDVGGVCAHTHTHSLDKRLWRTVVVCRLFHARTHT